MSQKVNTKKSALAILKALQWVVSMFLLTAGVGAMSDQNTLASGVALMLCALMLLPPVMRSISSKNGWLRAVYWTLAIGLFVLFAVSIPQTESTTHATSKKSKQAAEPVVSNQIEEEQTEPPLKPEPVIDPIKWSSRKTQDLGRVKQSYVVKTNRRATERELVKIANKLRGSEEMTFIGFWLNWMDIDQTGYASANFTPGLQVVYTGLTIEDVSSLQAMPIDSSLQIEGIWMDEDHLSVRCYLLFDRDDGKYIGVKYRSGLFASDRVKAKSSKLGVRYDKVSGPEAGEYFYIVDKEGYLQVYLAEDGKPWSQRMELLPEQAR